MAKNKYIVLGLHMMCCTYLIIQMALGAIYYDHLERMIGKKRPFSWKTVTNRATTRG